MRGAGRCCVLKGGRVPLLRAPSISLHPWVVLPCPDGAGPVVCWEVAGLKLQGECRLSRVSINLAEVLCCHSNKC